MKLAISNIAWDVDDDNEVANLLKRFGVTAIDVAPSKYFKSLATVSDHEIRRVKDYWLQHGISITGMQSLLFGTTGLNLFGGSKVRFDMLNHLTRVCDVAQKLGATQLVFGSPKNRDKGELSQGLALAEATLFFKKLGDIANDYGVNICIEANPISYGCNFLTSTAEAGDFVSNLYHPNIKLHLDLGTVIANHENLSQIVLKYGEFISHIHASEPNLVELGCQVEKHAQFAPIIKEHLSNRVISIEMLTHSNIHAIERALIVANHVYGDLN